jgi:hypothetical protein
MYSCKAKPGSDHTSNRYTFFKSISAEMNGEWDRHVYPGCQAEDKVKLHNAWKERVTCATTQSD